MSERMTTTLDVIEVFRASCAEPCRHCGTRFQHYIHAGCPCSGRTAACPHCGCPTAKPIGVAASISEETSHGR